MKKFIFLSLLMVASCGLANASNGLEMTKVKKEITTLVFEVVKPTTTAPSEKVNVVYCIWMPNGGLCAAGETREDALLALCIGLFGSHKCP